MIERISARGWPREGREIDADALANWAATHGVVINLLARLGDFVFPGAAIALAKPRIDGVADAIGRSTELGKTRVSTSDIEFAVRQLVEVAVRALSLASMIRIPRSACSIAWVNRCVTSRTFT